MLHQLTTRTGVGASVGSEEQVAWEAFPGCALSALTRCPERFRKIGEIQNRSGDNWTKAKPYFLRAGAIAYYRKHRLKTLQFRLID